MTDKKVHVLIVEDEPIVALDLATGLEQADFTVVGTASNARDAKDIFVDQEVDIVLMDIHLKGEEDGIDTVRELMRIKQTPVIYLTAFTDAATLTRVKDTCPAAFLVKPYHISNVLIAVELAMDNFSRREEGKTGMHAVGGGGDADRQAGRESKRIDQPEPLLFWKDHLFAKLNNRYVKISLSSILFLSADSNYIHLVTTEGKYPLRMGLNQFMEKISGSRLVRIHRSYAVNLDAIQSFTEQEVRVGKESLPIGRSFKDEFMQQFEGG